VPGRAGPLQQEPPRLDGGVTKASLDQGRHAGDLALDLCDFGFQLARRGLASFAELRHVGATSQRGRSGTRDTIDVRRLHDTERVDQRLRAGEGSIQTGGPQRQYAFGGFALLVTRLARLSAMAHPFIAKHIQAARDPLESIRLVAASRRLERPFDGAAPLGVPNACERRRIEIALPFLVPMRHRQGQGRRRGAEGDGPATRYPRRHGPLQGIDHDRERRVALIWIRLQPALDHTANPPVYLGMPGRAALAEVRAATGLRARWVRHDSRQRQERGHGVAELIAARVRFVTTEQFGRHEPRRPGKRARGSKCQRLGISGRPRRGYDR
jgi:hypothetical protein